MWTEKVREPGERSLHIPCRPLTLFLSQSVQNRLPRRASAKRDEKFSQCFSSQRYRPRHRARLISPVEAIVRFITARDQRPLRARSEIESDRTFHFSSAEEVFTRSLTLD